MSVLLCCGVWITICPAGYGLHWLKITLPFLQHQCLVFTNLVLLEPLSVVSQLMPYLPVQVLFRFGYVYYDVSVFVIRRELLSLGFESAEKKVFSGQ